MDVRMPDGTVISNVPDNITQQDLLARYNDYVATPIPPNVPAQTRLEPQLFGRAKEVANVPETGLSAEMSKEQFKSGLSGMQQGFYATAAKNNAALLNVLDAIDSGKKVTPIDDVLGYQDMNAEQRQQVRDSLQSSMTSSVAKTIKYGEEQKGYKRNPYADQVIGLANEGDYSGAWDAFKKDPTGVIQQLTVESAPNALPSLAGGVVGVALKGGLAGLMTGLASGSFPVEYMSSITDSLRDSGVNMKDEKAIDAKLRDPKFIEEAGKRAMTRGTVIAAADAASGKLLMPFKAGQIGKNVARGAANIATEVGTESAGEALAQVATGEDLKVGDILAEAIGAGPQAAATTATKTYMESKKPTTEDLTKKVETEVKKEIKPVVEATSIEDSDLAKAAAELAKPTTPAPVPEPRAPELKVAKAEVEELSQDYDAMMAELEGHPLAVAAKELATEKPKEAPKEEAPAVPVEKVVQPEIAEAPTPAAKEAVIQNRDRATPASISQMNKIAGDLDYDRVAVSSDFANGAPIVAGDIEIPESQIGRKGTATAADGTKIPVTYAVVDADTVLPSNNVDGSVNSKFFDPNFPGLKAIAGNARTAGIQAAYQRDQAEDYKTKFAEDEFHGINPEAIKGMYKPMLVRLMPKDRITENIGDISNVATNLKLSTIEQAKNDANRIDLQGLQFDDNGNITMSGLRGFISAMPTTEQGELINVDGLPTKQAIERLDAAVFQKAYENDTLTNLAYQAGDEESKRIIKAMAAAAPQMSRLAEAGEFDIRNQVAQAAEMAINAQRTGKKLAEVAKQVDITADPLASTILQMFADNARSGKAITENLTALANKAYEESQSAKEDMFGEKPKRTVDQVVTEAFTKPETMDLLSEGKERFELPSDQFIKEGIQITKDMRKALDKMGLSKVGLEFEDQMFRYLDGKLTEVAGTYFKNLITVSLSSTDVDRTLNHEALHAMKDLGLFSKSEWKILENMAKSKWIKQYDIAKGYESFSKEIQIEEAIAHAFADNKAQSLSVKPIFKKISDFMQRLKNAIMGRGFKTVEDVFQQAKEGKLTGKETKGEGGERLSVSERRTYAGEVAPLSEWTAPSESKMDTFIYKIQDKLVDTKRVIQAIKSQVGEISDKWDAYLKEELYHGRTSKRIKDFLQQEMLPLVREMQENGITVPEFDTYLHNRHAEERNAQIAKVNPSMPDSGSGISNAAAARYMANIDPAKLKVLESLAKKIDSIVDNTQKELVENGLEEQETIDAWNSTYEHYVPLMREDLDFVHHGSGLGQGFSTRGSASKRATGSLKNVVDIFGTIALQRERAIIRAEKARVGRALYGLAIKNPNTDFWLAVNPDAIKNKDKLEKEMINLGLTPEDANNIIQEPMVARIDKATGLVKYEVNPVLRNSDNVFPVRINGKDRFVFFNSSDPRAMRMAEAIKNLDAEQLGIVLGTIGSVTRWIASVNTQYNPVFGAWNFARDVQGAAVNLTSTPIAGKQKEVLQGTFPALFGIYKDLRTERKGEGAAVGEWAELWERFQKAGGQTGYKEQFTQRKNDLNIVEREFQKLEQGNVKQAVRSLFNWLSDYNDAMENAVRLSAFKVALDQGISEERAASIAKNLTVNFNRKGQLSPVAGSLYAFFNASIQGSARLAETLSGPAGRKIVAGGLALGVFQAIALAMAGFGDDDPPEFVKDKNFIIPIGDGKYIMFPLPLGLNMIPGIGRLATEYVLGKTGDIKGAKSAPKKITAMLGLMLDSFNPLGAGSLSQTIAPTVVDPIVAIERNIDAFGRPIAKADRSTNPTPGYSRSRDSASALSKYVAEFLNYVSGGTKYQKGALSPTGDQIDYIVGQYTGGVGREIMKTAETAKAVVTGEEVAPYRKPIIGKLVGDIESPSAISAKFYANVTRMAEHENEIKGRQKNRENAMEYKRDNPESRLWSEANSIENQISALNKDKKELIASGASKERIQKLDDQKTKIMKRFNSRVESLQ